MLMAHGTLYKLEAKWRKLSQNRKLQCDWLTLGSQGAQMSTWDYNNIIY